MVLRNSNQSSMGFLYNMEFTMQGMTSSGQTVDLPLVRSRYATWRNQCSTTASTAQSGRLPDGVGAVNDLTRRRPRR